ncbi:MAG: dTDP-4-dehydrorhamnose 3,5-epimerase [Candidatus Doudnabacteria bacterium RIFCSPHIGHO2_01_FULL_46_14]|uniref:dTDP-4-dehydrorhamnose 3,5-epimerase n=1 Tax=Candidatus Doudnabacteria bacterium RIFCSPHIGHO2_01_FULL_46_14 TaxID=1817824 RepID=A0A1F5NL69_9BACT|nr:MAG: dTDP-4-dehydrorhamnose 3,5-epimerase [Candidatus Doudnabacteria bacterium RIFCSPHIGHO2_01_FULL_46_14]
MKLHKTNLEGVYVVELEPKEDERGSFTRIFCQNELSGQGISFNIAQSNLSINKHKGILRGLHFQKPPKAEDRIVQCLKGAIYDVALDLRPDSPTYGKSFAAELSESNPKSMYIPKGVAHGFQTLADDSRVLYFMSEFYSPEHYFGVRWDDPALGLDWPIKNPILSSQDQNWPYI